MFAYEEGKPMTHEELLVIIDVNSMVNPKPLVEVVKLHSPSEWGNCVTCSGTTNETVIAYPCVTIQTIEKELA